MPNDNAVAVQQDDPKTFPGMLIAFKQQIAAALPKHITADRMARIALTSYRLNPMLARCTPSSVFAGVIQSAQLGLEIGLNGRAYLVPYKKRDGTYECQFIPGWKGLVELANRTGRCSVWTGAVFEGDEFDYQLGDNPFVHHKPGEEDDPSKLLYVYAVGRIKGSDYPQIEVWSSEKVRKHFKRYNKVGDRHYAHDNWEMYARKIPLLQVLKYMPSSPELEAAMAMANVADAGSSQGLNIKDAIEGTFAPPPATDDDQPERAGASSGNDAIKDAMRKSGAVDKATGEVSTKPYDNGFSEPDKPKTTPNPGGAPFSYQEIAAKLNGAKTRDDVDETESLIDSCISDAKQRTELHDLARARRLDFK